jgi:hypothetical protein
VAVLHESLSRAWSVQKRAVPIIPTLYFSPDGLALGAETILVPAIGPRCLANLQGEEARLLTLLSATFGKAISPSVLGNISRAAKSWGKGDDVAAAIYLTHAGLPRPDDPTEAARRLFVTDAFIKSGTSPIGILQALGLEASYVRTIAKLYNELELRVPAGNGIISGQWTAFLSFLAALPTPQTEQLGLWAMRLLAPFAPALAAGVGAGAAFGLIVIPSPNRIRVEGEVAGLPGGHYSWNRDETQLYLRYDAPDGGQRTVVAWRRGNTFVDDQRRVVGRILTDDWVLIDAGAVSPDLLKDDEPRACPAPGPDKPSGVKGRTYEDFVKTFVNPPPYTTPTGIGFQLANLQAGGKLVYFDDCQHTTGMMVEAKGPGYANLLTYKWGRDSLAEDWLEQSDRQLAALGSRRLRWYFAEPEAAEFAQKLFAEAGGRERIEIIVLPYPGSNK